ncbi:MAG: hypothetical protein ACD_50C00008G0002, partial [uncultured bacterium]
LAEEAADRAATLIAEVSGGEVLKERVDAGEKKDKEKKVALGFERLKSFLGENISVDRAISILESLGFKTVAKTKEKAEFIVPYWRLDVSIEEDLLEEVARIYGYGNIPSTLPEGTLPVYEKNERVEISKKIRDILTALGFFEVYSYSFTSKEKAEIFRKNIDLVHIANSLSQEQEYMRTDLLGSMLEIAAKNKGYKSADVLKVYEIASTYSTNSETLKISALVFGRNKEAVLEEEKGSLETLCSQLGIYNISLKIGLNGQVKIFSGQKEIGHSVYLDNEKMVQFKVKWQRACFFEFDIKALEEVSKPKKFKQIPRFPSSERDLTFVVEEKVTVAEIYETIDKIKSGIRAGAEVVNVYRGKGLPEGKKSISVRFIYQAKDRTLTDKEVDDDQTAIIKKIKDALGGTLRSEGS